MFNADTISTIKRRKSLRVRLLGGVLPWAVLAVAIGGLTPAHADNGMTKAVMGVSTFEAFDALGAVGDYVTACTGDGVCEAIAGQAGQEGAPIRGFRRDRWPDVKIVRSGDVGETGNFVGNAFGSIRGVTQIPDGPDAVTVCWTFERRPAPAQQSKDVRSCIKVVQGPKCETNKNDPNFCPPCDGGLIKVQQNQNVCNAADSLTPLLSDELALVFGVDSKKIPKKESATLTTCAPPSLAPDTYRWQCVDQANLGMTSVTVNATNGGLYLYDGGGAWYLPSDARLKTDVQPVGDALDRLARLHGVAYRFKDDADGRAELGVIAQEVEAVFPELVVRADDDANTRLVNYLGLIAPLIEAVKELKAENEALKARLDAAGLE